MFKTIGQFFLHQPILKYNKSIAFFSIFLILTIPFCIAYDLSYDANGNLIKDNNYEYEYDEFNQLIKIKDLDGNALEEYVYDDSGNRIKKIDHVNNKIIYYPDKNFVRENNQDIVYYYDGNNLLARKDSTGTYYYHPDHLGSTTLVTDENENKVEETSYLPFGAVFSGGDDRYTFTGQELDKTGLMYYGARYYSPELRHFTQPDTILTDVYDPQQLNRYSYVRNNPYKYVDPNGNFIVTAFFATLLGINLIASTLIIGDYIANPSKENFRNVMILAGLEAIGVGALSGVFKSAKNVISTTKIGNTASKITNLVKNSNKVSKVTEQYKIITKISKVGKELIKPDINSINKKLYDYSLNPKNLVGRNKANVFKSALGYNQKNYGSLKNQIINKFDINKLTKVRDTNFGPVYRQIIEVTGPNSKKAKVLTGWMIEDNKARLITCYVMK